MRWPTYQHIFFDCDSTLTTVEGIDALADTAGGVEIHFGDFFGIAIDPGMSLGSVIVSLDALGLGTDLSWSRIALQKLRQGDGHWHRTSLICSALA